MRDTYNGEQKEKAIAVALDIGVSVASRKLGISRTALTKWIADNEVFYIKLQATIRNTNGSTN